ncbi:MAG: hypothetical protein EBR82_71400, partial [Caulobacteraceae bacterium]|nr:hypothetical protein [Caulobacteraceae bacterium]
MALPILDGNQTSTTLATTVSGGAHYPNHIISNFPATQQVAGTVTVGGGVYLTDAQVALGNNAPAEAVQVGGYNLADNKLYPIAVNSDGVQSVADNNWVYLGHRNWVSDQSNWNFDFTGYSSIKIFAGGDTSGSVIGTWSGQDGLYANYGTEITVGLFDGNIIDYTLNWPFVSFAIQNAPQYAGDMWVYASRNCPLTNTQLRASPVPVSGTVTANVQNLVFESSSPAFYGVPAMGLNPGDEYANLLLDENGRLYVSASGTATVTVGNSVTIGSLPVELSTTTIGGTARLNVTLSSATTVGATAPSYANLYGGSDGTNLRAISVDTSGRTVVTGSTSILGTPSVTMGAISGTVTANNPNGTLTTRFGSVTTANTAQITTAVTNTSRKYLLAQNISTATVTIGIGFSPTTTQGIQLTAGAGLTFDSFVPTGAVYWLGATTGAAYTIL